MKEGKSKISSSAADQTFDEKFFSIKKQEDFPWSCWRDSQGERGRQELGTVRPRVKTRVRLLPLFCVYSFSLRLSMLLLEEKGAVCCMKVEMGQKNVSKLHLVAP